MSIYVYILFDFFKHRTSDVILLIFITS